MKSFDEIYKELENEEYTELNSAWEVAKKENDTRRLIAVVICLIIDIFIIATFFKNGINFTFGFFIIFMLVTNIMFFTVITTFFRKKYNDYNVKYKNIVINKLMNNFYDNLEYYPNKPIPEYIYEKCNYNEYYNRYMSEDYMEGQIGDNYSIQMGEVKTEEVETYKDSKGNTQTRTITKFHGLFSKVLMHKSIKGELRVMQNGNFLLNKERLQMDSSEFEKYFDVKASDKIVGMQILTADVMQELIEFQNNTNIKYDICIKDNELYLRFHCGEMFEIGKLKNGPIDRETIRKYFYMLNFTYNLSNKVINIINDTEI